MYVCNIMTQPGETDGYKVSDHIKAINRYLGNKKVGITLVNNGNISREIKEKYATLEQKDPVILDKDELEKIPVRVIEDDFISIEDDILRHNITKLGFHIFSYIML